MSEVKERNKMHIGKPLFGNVFGDNNTIKVLDFLFMGKDLDFTLTHIHNGTGLSRTAIRNALEQLLNNELVEKSREDEKSKYYRISRNNKKFKILENLYNQIMKEIIAN